MKDRKCIINKVGVNNSNPRMEIWFENIDNHKQRKSRPGPGGGGGAGGDNLDNVDR